MMKRTLSVSLFALAVGCAGGETSDTPPVEVDSGNVDTGSPVDTGAVDTGALDTGALDTGSPEDSTTPDTAADVEVDTGPSCTDSVKNGTETDIDCGGGSCPQCADSKACGGPSDCLGGICASGKCASASCTDSVKNGTETDIDCGGATCPKCPDGKGCATSSDCTGGLCNSGTCASPTCTDAAKNGSEADVDCGGGACPACGTGLTCAAASDCQSSVCTALKCVAASCTDAVKNGAETDVDCGGGCPANCADGKGCGTDADCISGVCTSGSCAAPVCTDTVKNGTETDVDCGGATCPKCAGGKACKVSLDCASGICSSSGVCTAATCGDSVKNGTETDVDCGGTCPRCGTGKSCLINKDCTDGLCGAGKCVGSCTDATKSGAETDVDCGGDTTCPRCPYTRLCTVNTDCASNTCVGGRCRARSCLQLHTLQPTLPSGVYTLSPNGTAQISAYCEMSFNGGGWTILSINGSTASSTCRHRLKSDAPACGTATAPALTSDWQMAGSLQNLFTFREVLLANHGYLSGVYHVFAASKLTLSSYRTVGDGILTGVPASLPTAYTSGPLSCTNNVVSVPFTSRTRIAVNAQGYSVWGSSAATTCPGSAGVGAHLGLAIETINLTHPYPGWSTDNVLTNCRCDVFSPNWISGATWGQGFFAVR